jgi:ABC-type sugar transport system ATPase subunit
MVRLQVDDLDISDGYQQGVIVSGVSFAVAAGERLALLGPSGSGKTSILRAIAGFIPRRAVWSRWGTERRSMHGRITVDGSDVTDAPPGDRGVALVPQNLALFPEKTVLDNMAFPLWAKGSSRRNAREQAAKLAKSLGLTGLAERYPDQISGGQQQRVAVGRALVGEPKIVLFDEPLAGLDGPTKSDVLAFIDDALRQQLAAAVFVTHDAREAETLCDEIAFLHDHRVHQVACPKEAYDNPATPFVAASFAGFENVVPGELVPGVGFVPSGAKGSWVVDANGAPAGTSGVLACRPRGLEFRPGGAGAVSGRQVSRLLRDGEPYVKVEITPGVRLLCRPQKAGGEGMAGCIVLSEGPGDFRFFPKEQR